MSTLFNKTALETNPAQDSKTVVFQTYNLTKVYDMGEIQVQALRGVDLKFYAGELAVLLGTSGSGKSTLLNILGGLDTPPAGRSFISIGI